MALVAPPGVLGTWAFDLLREACSLVGDQITARLVDRLDEVEGLGEASGRPRMLCLSQFTSASLRTAMAAGAIPIVVFLDDPIDSVRYLKFASGCSTLEALRIQTAAAVSSAFLCGNPTALAIDRATSGRARDTVLRILDHLELDLLPSAFEILLGKFAGPESEQASLEARLARHVAGYAPLEAASTELAPREAEIVNRALAPIVQMSRSPDPAPIVWPTSVFFSGDQPGSPAALVADVTGGARILYYGPYFHLPRGNWGARLMIGFTEDARGIPFSIEVHAGLLLARATMQSIGKGVFHASFQFAHEAPQNPVEIQVRSDQGAIGGKVALGRVEFNLLPAGSPVAGLNQSR
ncbi:MAG TPA: hypothetical protein VGH40_03655 [Roseiarcus sp.]|jgi:hypothetical protein